MTHRISPTSEELEEAKGIIDVALSEATLKDENIAKELEKDVP